MNLKNIAIIILILVIIVVVIIKIRIKEIPQNIVNIEKTGVVSDLNSLTLTDVLAKFSTNYNEENISRTTNVRLASNKINNAIVMPNEVFSYNNLVGERTLELGFKEATGYFAGKTVNTVGGGICQVSSTLYNAAIYANLEIVERTSHQFLPSYVSAGEDATVVWGLTDFKFKNTRKYPIKIVCSAINGKCEVLIYGIKEDIEYKVETESVITEELNYKTIYEEDSTMKKGEQKVTQEGAKGKKSRFYKVLKLNGKFISKTLLSVDVYNPKNTYISIGTN
ncbi:MAG: VanW family protein [Lachnospiraceae bacterium]|jgi:vancomycin resistance protein YoaR|nr:VanW family protein [Lachnospiraceae bacterium]